ncbi:kinase-like protein [Athelia psychrophila]|uniref:Kinase-like protein n=1 Tax=Athelia psychrophila TaxID=1759441 RepID=A0A166TMX8_9AGAM|nr:kinase-like protein [Fibularhizoctonia sp. CBS 109695]
MSALAYAGSEPAALPSCARRYCREIEIWKNLCHEHIAPLLGIVFGFGPHGSTGMVFPWMDKGTLNSFLEKNEPSTADRFQLCPFIFKYTNADSIEVHHQGIVHGDLNGANIFVDDSMNASIVGFGVSIEDIEFDGASLAGGTMRWRSPELLSPAMEDSGDFAPVLTSACDIFSFGSITLHILTGKIPYHDVSPDICVLLALVRGTLPWPPPGFNDGYMSFINRCWGTSASSRPDIRTVESELCALRETTLD